jgi:hypothetical protein
MGLALLEQDREQGIREDFGVEDLLQPMKSLVTARVFVEALHADHPLACRTSFAR